MRTGTTSLALAAAAVGAAVVLGGAVGVAGATDSRSGDGVGPEVVRATVDSAGLVRSAGRTGSGWVAGTDSVVTNFHVARGGSGDIYVDFSDGERRECWTAAADRDMDLAVLKCETGGRRPVQLRVDVPPPGTPVAVVGYPRGIGPTTTTGVLRPERQRIHAIDVIAVTAEVKPGSSGSPVVGPDGSAMGVITYSQGRAVPAANLAPLLDVADRLPVSKAAAEWTLRLRRVAVVAPVVFLVAWLLRHRYSRPSPALGALGWAGGSAVVVLVLTQVQLALEGPVSFI